jgi:hypothetical protein
MRLLSNLPGNTGWSNASRIATSKKHFHLSESYFCRFKHFHRVAMRCHELRCRVESFAHLAAALCGL